MASARRAARAQTAAGTEAATHPPELRSRLLPFWGDLDRIAARFGEYLDPWERESIIYRSRPSALYLRVVSRWAVANGFESPIYPRMPDWHALRAAGVIE